MKIINISFLTVLFCLLTPLCLHGEITIEECVRKAEANYPLIRKYELLKATRDIELSEINRSWLPRAGVYGQITVQNNVPSFPELLTDVLQQMGGNIRGTGKIQYKAGIDISQPVWDGGTSRARREVTRAREAVQQSALDVELYTVRQRVENIYFAILLTEEQIARNSITYNLLLSNLERLHSMLRNGTAMKSDVDMVEAQAIMVNQGITQARSAVRGYRNVLEIFIGENIGNESLVLPVADIPPTNESDRPEMRLFEKRLAANAAAGSLHNTYLMPEIGLFAQAFYGYPSFNYFKSMMNRKLSFNIMAGVKVSWNISSLYTKQTNARRVAAEAEEINTDREVFFFNSDIQSASQIETINGLHDIMKDDAKIISLRANVRRAAESQLQNGIIDTTALLAKISDENTAELTAALHRIQLQQEIYKLKYTLNR